MHPVRLFSVLLSTYVSLAAMAGAAAVRTNTPTPGDRQLAGYFRQETDRLEARCLAEVKTLAEWERVREQRRGELFEMLGLSPLPPRTDLKPVITGRLEHPEFTVEKLHFQSLPGLYVGANLYLPKERSKPLPAILYVCGHALVETNGVRLGNKTGYQHHGEWFARHGYVCLTIDTIQLGELKGEHHGTHNKGMWWWNSRGYTPAGVEAWNGIRALDYLQSRPEVDGSKLGVTGRSGGGAYSWWVAALDERIKAACPVAGITDLHNHVVDGVVQGHCDCMFMVNTYRWDYAQVAALVAPRPLLIGNTDKDGIFPLEGVVRLHEKVRRIYQLHGAGANLGLLIAEGPHKDTQDLQVPVFRWFNRFLKNEDPLIATPAAKLFAPADLKVFKELPADERTTRIHESFVPIATNQVPASEGDWQRQRSAWMKALRERCFAGWPSDVEPVPPTRAFSIEQSGARLSGWDFTSQPGVPLRLYTLAGKSDARPRKIRVEVLDEAAWAAWLPAMRRHFTRPEALQDEAAVLAQLATNNLTAPLGNYDPVALAREADAGQLLHVFVVPRGVGLTAWNPAPREAPHLRRRFMLLGQTLDGMRVWDIQRALAVVGKIQTGSSPLTLAASRQSAVNALYASLFATGVGALDLRDVPGSHHTGPDYLNVLRFLDVPQAAAMAAETINVRLTTKEENAWSFTRETARQLHWPGDRVQINAAR